MLYLLDFLLSLLHFAIVGFNLFGWIWARTRRLHLVVAGLTLASWGVLGIWYGFGYCPITDWQWSVKRRLGETNLPGSFVTYWAEKLYGGPVDSGMIDVLTGVCFALAILFSLYFNFIIKRRPA